MSNSPAAATCTLTPAGTITDVPFGRKYSVTYTFNTNASGAANLPLPYAVEVNGVVLPEHEEKPRSLGADRKIALKVESRSKVALYLNSDARQEFRTQPVYALQVGERDVQVTITEQLGRSNTETATFRGAICTQAPDGKRFDRYDATLTGDIWMKISHRYSVAEASKLIPADTDPATRAAVLSIYAPLGSRTLAINFPANGDTPAQTMQLSFVEQDSVLANVSYCPLLSHVFTRTHPHCYLALITEARAAGVTRLRVNSAWRPLLGSIVHRAGLGLDVDYVESGSQQLTIERKSLKDGKKRSGGNVTQEEKDLYDEMMRKQTELNIKKDAASRFADAAKRSPGDTGTAQRHSQAQDELREASVGTTLAETAWKERLGENQPAVVRSLRARLVSRKDVKQVLDPWYIDLNTRDSSPAAPNKQLTAIEQGHNNHLHITIKESGIL